MEIESTKKKAKEKLEAIKEKLQVLLKENEDVDEKKKMERDEFAVDMKRKNEIEARQEDMHRQIHQESRFYNDRMELVGNKIKECTIGMIDNE